MNGFKTSINRILHSRRFILALHSRLPSLLTNSLHWSTCIYIRIYWAFGIAIYILCIWCCVTILTSSHLLCFLLTLSSFDDHNELFSIQQCYEFQVHLNCLTSNTVSLTNVTSRLSGLLLFLNWGLSVQIVQGDSGAQTGRAVNSIIVWREWFWIGDVHLLSPCRVSPVWNSIWLCNMCSTACLSKILLAMFKFNSVWNAHIRHGDYEVWKSGHSTFGCKWLCWGTMKVNLLAGKQLFSILILALQYSGQKK